MSKPKLSFIAIAILSLVAATNAEPIHIPIKRLHNVPSPLSKRDNIINNSNSSSNVSLYNDLGQVYLAEIGVGTPPQNFTVIIDTQSSDLWIPSAVCKKTECPSATFNVSQSSTFKLLNESFGYYYEGEINGTYALDTVTLGGISVAQQQFALVYQADKSVIADDYRANQKYGGAASAQGVLGLGYKSMLQVPENASLYDPLLYSMVNQSLIPQHVFSIYTNSVMSEGWAGELTLGGVNTDKFTGSIRYADVAAVSMDTNETVPADYALWVVQGQSLSVMDEMTSFNATTQQNQTSLIPKTILPFQQSDSKYVLIDTGTSLSYIGGLYAAQIVSAITLEMQPELDSSSGCYIVDCGLKNSTKYIELGFARYHNGTGNVRVSVPVKNLIQPQHVGKSITGVDDTCIFSLCSWPKSDNNSDDTDDDSDTLDDIPIFIFGDSILRSIYLVFDGVRNRIGFASAINSDTIVQ